MLAESSKRGEVSSTSTGFSILLPHKCGTGSWQRLNDTTRSPARETCEDAVTEITALHADDSKLPANGIYMAKEEPSVDGRLHVEHLPEVYISHKGITRDGITKP